MAKKNQEASWEKRSRNKTRKNTVDPVKEIQGKAKTHKKIIDVK